MQEGIQVDGARVVLPQPVSSSLAPQVGTVTTYAPDGQLLINSVSIADWLTTAVTRHCTAPALPCSPLPCACKYFSRVGAVRAVFHSAEHCQTLLYAC